MGGPPHRLPPPPPPRPRHPHRPSAGDQTPGTGLSPTRVFEPPAGPSDRSAVPVNSTGTRAGFPVADRCPPKMAAPRPRSPLRSRAQPPDTRLPPPHVFEPPAAAGSSAKSAAPASSTDTRIGFSDRCAPTDPRPRPPVHRGGPTQDQDPGCSGSLTSVKRARYPPSSSSAGDGAEEDEQPAATRRRLCSALFPAGPSFSRPAPSAPRPRLGGVSDAIGRLPRSLQSASSQPSSGPSASSSQAGMNFYWNGPGLHRFHRREQLLLSISNLNRFLSRREELCILQNAVHFLRSGTINDASDDPRRRDYTFLVVSRRTLLDMGLRAGAIDEKFWPGYKERYYDLSEERKISTLKFDENTFLWRHEVSGSRLLRRRVSLDDDKGPFADDNKVFYILQYHKLPRTKKSKKAEILAERARRGHF